MTFSRKSFALALLLFCAATTPASAQGWSAGDSPVVSNGTSVTVSTAQPPIVRFTDNGALTFVTGGSVTITGTVTTAVGSGTNAAGALALNGGSITHQGSGYFVVGYLGGTGSVTIASGATLEVSASRFRLAGNEEGLRDLPSHGEAVISGTLRTPLVDFTGFFPSNLAPPYAECAKLTLNEGGVVEAGSFAKNDCAVSTFQFNGGTLRAKQTTTSFIAGLGVLAMVIADGKNAVFDTNGKDITIVPQSAPYDKVLTLRGETNALSVGNGGLVKTGAGALILRLAASENTFTGAIAVVQGTLDLGRALAPNQTVVVNTNATFVMYSASDTNKVTVLGAPDARMLYAVGADLDALDLTALNSAFFDDRLGTSLSGSATLRGTLTHDASAGVPAKPFRLIGQGGSLNLTNTTLESKAVQVEGPGTFNFMGSRTYTAADAGKIVIADGGYRQDQTFNLADASPAAPATLSLPTGRFLAGASLDVAAGGYGALAASGAAITAGRARIGGGSGFTGAFNQSTGTVTLSNESYVGFDGGTGTLSVAGGQFVVNADLRIASNPGDTTSRTLRPGGSITVSNALLRCNTLYFTSWWPMDGSCSNLQVGALTLQSGAQAEVSYVNKNDDPIGTILFDGGLLRARSATAGFLSVGQPYGTLRVIASANQYATFDVGANEVTLQTGAGRLVFAGAGGFKKLGSGRLTFSASDASYTGDTVIAAGTLRLGNSNQLPDGPGKGNIQISTNAVLDLNGKSESINRLLGAGSVLSTNGAATLGVLANGASDAWQRSWLLGNVALDKQGTGTLTLAAGNVVASNATVSAGTLRLTSSDSYPYYRFKVEGIKNPSGSSGNAMQLSEIALFDNGVNVTSNRTGILYDSTGGVGGNALANAFPPGELPEMAVDGVKPADGSATNNKWLDFRAATNRTAADRERVWLRIDFPTAQKITHYNWATGNDASDRDPAAWRLQGSYNGTDWSDIDVQSNFVATATRNAWASGGGFAVSSANQPNAIGDRANVAVNAGASLLLDGVSESFGGLTGYGAVTLSNANLTVGGSTNTAALFGGTLAGNGSLIKTGPGTQNICGTNALTGDIVVQGGTLAVQGGSPSTWFRLTLKKNKTGINVTQLSEVALYSADGVRRNQGLAQGASTNALLQGQFATPVAYSTGSGSEGPDKLFDNATGTKWCVNNNIPVPETPSTHRVVVMRLTNTVPEIVSYNFCTANDVPERDPVTWTLESSPDGANWATVDARADVVPPTGRFTWYNSAAAYALAARAIIDGDTDSIPNGSVVEVRAGATLSVTNGLDVIGALRVDMQSAGTLTKLTAKTNGALYLVNATGRPNTWTIPLAIPSVTNPGALKSWTVYANGAQLKGYTLTYDAATGKFLLKSAGTLIVLH